MLSEHVLALHSGSKNKRKGDASTSNNNPNILSSQAESDIPLR